MKKNILFIVSVFIVMLALTLYLNNDVENIIYESKTTKLSTSDTLAMMYETEAGSGEYEVVDDTTWPQEGYVFNAELSKCENGSTLYWDDETKSVMMEANVSDKCYVYFDKEPDIIYLADYIVNTVYTSDGVNGLYYHDGQGMYTNADQEAGDNSYRYSGANPNNYVCFGSDDASCPNDNLYRIIGVFDNQVKLIKYDYANSDLLGTDGDYYGDYGSLGSYYKGKQTSVDGYYWNNNTGNNTWSESNLNTINLNTNFLNNIGSEWANKIATTNWKVGGNTTANIFSVSVKQTYQNEIVSPVDNGDSVSNKIGLIYVSDYGYAASPENWTTTLNSYNNSSATNNNWMFMGLSEWTISRDSGRSIDAFNVSSSGQGTNSTVYRNDFGVRPSFYLDSLVTYVSGSGSMTDPLRIA